MGGGHSSDNLVFLTAEEHYVAHQLLVKIHPEVKGLATAAVYMSKQCTGNKAYAWLRKKHAALTSIRSRGNKYALLRKRVFISSEQREQIRARMTGRKASDATRQKLSKLHKGKRKSEATRARMSVAQKGRIISPETRAKISIALTGRPMDLERLRKMNAKAHTSSAKEKRSKSMLGNTNNLGKLATPETRAKMSSSQTLRWARLKQEHRIEVSP
jgi:hypothetical protein